MTIHAFAGAARELNVRWTLEAGAAPPEAHRDANVTGSIMELAVVRVHFAPALDAAIVPEVTAHGQSRLAPGSEAALALDYEALPGLEDVLVEGSFVLDVVDEPGTVRVLIHAAVTTSHPWYAPPDPASPHCFLLLQIVFRSVRKVAWFARSELAYVDAEGRRDRGCIDRFVAVADGSYLLEGDWGGLTIASAAPMVHLFGPRPEASGERRDRLDAWLAGA